MSEAPPTVAHQQEQRTGLLSTVSNRNGASKMKTRWLLSASKGEFGSRRGSLWIRLDNYMLYYIDMNVREFGTLTLARGR